jgi:hypothetical protein
MRDSERQAGAIGNQRKSLVMVALIAVVVGVSMALLRSPAGPSVPRETPHPPKHTRADGAAGAPAAPTQSSAPGRAPPPRFKPETAMSRPLVSLRPSELSEHYNREFRDLIWASQMESTLKNYFSPEVLERMSLHGVTVVDLECRTQLCRFEMDFPADLFKNPPYPKPQGWARFSAFDAILKHVGPFADRISDQSRPLPDAPTPTIRVSGVAVFNEGNRDPAHFKPETADKIPTPAEIAAKAGEQGTK